MCKIRLHNKGVQGGKPLLKGGILRGEMGGMAFEPMPDLGRRGTELDDNTPTEDLRKSSSVR